jgi:hypothetical protein
MNPSSWFGAGWDSRLQVLWETANVSPVEDGAMAATSTALRCWPSFPPRSPTPRSLDRLAHEYGLKDELDGARAVRPLSLVRERGQTVLLLEDPGASRPSGCSARPWKWAAFCASPSP